MLFTVIGWGVAFALSLFCACVVLLAPFGLHNADDDVWQGWGIVLCASIALSPIFGVQFGKTFDDYNAYRTYTAKEQALRQYEADAACRACCCNKPMCDEVKRE